MKNVVSKQEKINYGNTFFLLIKNAQKFVTVFVKFLFQKKSSDNACKYILIVFSINVRLNENKLVTGIINYQ